MTPLSAIETLHPRSLKHLSDTLSSLVREHLWAQVLLGMALGIALGIALGPTTGWVSREASASIASWVALPGQVFLALVQMIVIPLVFASIIRGLVSSEDVEQLKKTGGLTVLFFVLTTTVSITVGIGLALLVGLAGSCRHTLRARFWAMRPRP